MWENLKLKLPFLVKISKKCQNSIFYLVIFTKTPNIAQNRPKLVGYLGKKIYRPEDLQIAQILILGDGIAHLAILCSSSACLIADC